MNRKESSPLAPRYGPCQTPTLGFCVERHQRIATFTPENFWSVRPSVQKGGRRIQLEWERGRVFDKEIAQVFQRIVVEGGGAQVLEFGSKEERKGRPAGLNTVELLKIASSGLNLGPHHAMQVCTVCAFSSFPTQRFRLVFHHAMQVCAFCGFIFSSGFYLDSTHRKHGGAAQQIIQPAEVGAVPRHARRALLCVPFSFEFFSCTQLLQILSVRFLH